MWTYLLTAIALLLVMEGLLPFISPTVWRNMIIKMASRDDLTIRIVGLVTMVVGAIIMVLLHSGLLIDS